VIDLIYKHAAALWKAELTRECEADNKDGQGIKDVPIWYYTTYKNL